MDYIPYIGSALDPNCLKVETELALAEIQTYFYPELPAAILPSRCQTTVFVLSSNFPIIKYCVRYAEVAKICTLS